MNTKILIVDDNKSILRTLKAQFAELHDDWHVMTADTGVEGLDILRTQDVHLLLLDIMMPGMDGWEVCARMKGDDDLSNIPIVFLTAKTDEMSKAMGAISAVDYVEKPFDMVDLNKRITQVLDRFG